MTPFFMPAIGVLVAIGGGMAALAGASPVISLIVVVLGICFGVGSLVAALFSKGSQPVHNRNHSCRHHHHH